MATSEETAQLSAILTTVGTIPKPQCEVTALLAMVGQRYRGALMVVGRAVYGWKDSRVLSQLADHAGAAEFADSIRKTVEADSTGRCPMLWVTDIWEHPKLPDKRTNNRSSFWRVIRSVIRQLGIADAEDAAWPSTIVWSNLYKVAPARGANPTGRLLTIQQSGCIDLFRLELKTYRPSRLLLLTGNAWAIPFLSLGASDDESWSFERPFIERSGVIPASGTRYVVAPHPQGKDEKRWVTDVISVFES